MGSRSETARYLENWQEEVDSAAEYRAMAAGEPDPRLAKVYTNLAAMEEAHIAFWEARLRTAGAPIPPRRPSWRSRVLGGIARRFGPELVLATIAAKEEVDQNAYLKQPEPASANPMADLRHQFAEQGFQRIGGGQVVPGNRLRVLRDARENYPAWAAAIESARRTIHLEMYIVHDDATGRRFRDALVARAKAGRFLAGR